MSTNPPLPMQRASRPGQPRAVPPTPLSRPKWFDFLLILFGCAVSLLLTDLSRFEAAPSADTPSWAWSLPFRSLAYMLFLPVGVLLLFPLFYLTQRIAGRRQSLTLAEWLWIVTWLPALVLTAGMVWQSFASAPPFLRREAFEKWAYLGYAVTMLALAVVALVLRLADLFGRWPRPWTHFCALALLMWPALPIAVLLLCRIQMAVMPR